MIYTTVSSEVVIDRVIRRTRLTDASYADDMLGWLGEYVGNFRIKAFMQPHYKSLMVQNHIVKLPCGLTLLDGILYNGCRLRYGSSRVDPRISKFDRNKSFDTYFKTDTKTDGFLNNEQSYLLIRGDDLRQAFSSESATDYYIPYPNYIQTSFEQGCVHLFYQSIPFDENGYAMIPDEENSITGAIWYIYAMMALTGYKHQDPRMDYEYCEKKFLVFMRAGKRKLKLPSEDKLESMANANLSLIPPHGYYEKFNINKEQPRFVNK